MGFQPKHLYFASQFELRRRSGLGDEKARRILLHGKNFEIFISLQPRASDSLCLVIFKVLLAFICSIKGGWTRFVIITLEGVRLSRRWFVAKSIHSNFMKNTKKRPP